MESANQLGLVMTYGISTISGFGLYSLIAGIPGYLNLQGGNLEFTIATIAVIINGLLYFTSAILIATRLPELSGRVAARKKEVEADKPGFAAMFRDGIRFAAATPLVRGLVIGMIGAFAAAGVVIATAKLYAQSLLGGASTFGLLFVAVFVGLAIGMATAPRLAQRLAYNRLFGVTIVGAGLTLVLVALAPHLWIALLAVALVGTCAGVAFLTGLTIVGSQVEDEANELRAVNRIAERYTDGVHVNVTSFNRVILLTGEVPDAATREAIEKIVAGLPNVRSVANELEVAGVSSITSRSNDSLITSKVKVRFLDDSELAIGAGSELVLDEFVYDPSASTGARAALALTTGVFRFVSASGGHGRDFAVATPTATIGVRGTDFVVVLKEDGETVVGTLTGLVSVTENKTGRSVGVGPGSYVRVSARDDDSGAAAKEVAQ